ncbi:energy-coupling factor ABC transporter substrate-binding protein [Actinosynnema pretiosum]|uniref:Cobalt transport protein CbiN n=1 Tax=Actinosynnema pretiosum TaxID=42197 RepID=A0A290Z7L7_9PSEU|nr:energy-coupling factor ABC transporter substrate-binding protein [Actinosynnema pretiosum]ATE54972.1 energy-coupling factor ABC transporter substrate-binding protein [Actinosynnema pretiosum]
MRRTTTNVLLVLASVAVFAVALALGTGKGEFGGTDATATEQIEESAPDYEPWFEPLWTQPGGEVESGLFALQAALGAGLLGFALGTFRERRKHLGDRAPGEALPGSAPDETPPPGGGA